MANEYKFDYVFLWQQTILNAQKPLTREEQNALAAAQQRSPGLQKADQAARRLIQADSMPHVFDIADVFDQVHDTIYFDQAHVSALGNRLAAQRIYEVVWGPSAMVVPTTTVKEVSGS